MASASPSRWRPPVRIFHTATTRIASSSEGKTADEEPVGRDEAGAQREPDDGKPPRGPPERSRAPSPPAPGTGTMVRNRTARTR